MVVTTKQLEDARQQGTESFHKFISSTIEQYRNSSAVSEMLKMQEYHDGESPVKKTFGVSTTTKSGQSANIKPRLPIASNFAFTIVNQHISRLLYHPVAFDDVDIYNKLGGKRFQHALKRAGILAATHGVSYTLHHDGQLLVFPATSFCPIINSTTGAMEAGIRTFRVGNDTDAQPWNIQLFEVDGWAEWTQAKDEDLVVSQAKRPYNRVVRQNKAGQTWLESEQSNTAFPVQPYYVNTERRSLLTNPVRTKIDLFDAISTLHGDTVLCTKAIYWIIQGYSGCTETLEQLREKINELGIIVPTGGNAEEAKIDLKNVDIPYEAAMELLKWLKAEIYIDGGIRDPDALSSGGVTAQAIRASGYNEDIFSSGIEWSMTDNIERTLAVLGIENETIVFTHKTIEDDEAIDRRIIMYSGILAPEDMLEMSPLAQGRNVEEMVKRGNAYHHGMSDADIAEYEGGNEE